MLLPHHDEDTPLEECLLILSENAVRYLWLLDNGQTNTREFFWLAQALDSHNPAIADMHILGLIEICCSENADPAPTPSETYRIEQRGRKLLELAKETGVDFEDLAIDIEKITVMAEQDRT